MGNWRSALVAWWTDWNSEKPDPVAELRYNNFSLEVLTAVNQGDYVRLEELHAEGKEQMGGGVDCVGANPPLLQRAASRGHTHVVKFLIDLGMDVDESDTSGMTALHEACKKGQNKCVVHLVSRSRDIDKRDVWGRTPLIKAMVYRNVEAVKMLLERGANPNAMDTYGITPLVTAVNYNLMDVVQLLVSHGADVNLLSVSYQRVRSLGLPLYLAINNQNTAMTRELLRLGANTQPRQQDSYGNRNVWHQYFSANVQPSVCASLPTLQHSDAVAMAMSEMVRRGNNDLAGLVYGMEILMEVLSAHGHPLGPSPDVLIRVLINSRPEEFSMLMHKLQICSSNCSDILLRSLTSSPDVNANLSRPAVIHRPTHLQQMDRHMQRNVTPRIVTSLQDQARRAARKAVMASGRNVVWACERLQCPPALKSLLLLRDIDRAYAHPHSHFFGKPH